MHFGFDRRADQVVYRDKRRGRRRPGEAAATDE